MSFTRACTLLVLLSALAVVTQAFYTPYLSFLPSPSSPPSPISRACATQLSARSGGGNSGGARRTRRRKQPSETGGASSGKEKLEVGPDLQVKSGTQYDPSLSELFTDDWSGMQAPPGMAPSKLSPLTGTQPDPNAGKSAAELYKEGELVKYTKYGTWFGILALVLWEIYIHSPLFHPSGGGAPTTM